MISMGVVASQMHATGLVITDTDDIANLGFDFDAESGVTTSAGAVTQWVDRINGVTVTQGTSGNRPTLQANVLNTTYDAVRFDGSNDFLAATHANTADATVVAVVRLNSAAVAENQTIVGEFNSSSVRRAFVARRSGSGGNSRMAIFYEPPSSTFHDADTFTTTLDTWYVLGWRIDGTSGTRTFDYFSNTTDYGQDTSANAQPSCSTLWLGKAGSTSGYLKGDVARVVKYDRRLTDAELKAVRNLLGATTYAIHSTIP
jgi:hypothetical protein